MFMMSIYYCMLLSNWNVIGENESVQTLTQTWTSFWIKLFTLLLSGLLYLWVLIAPILFPDREFDF